MIKHFFQILIGFILSPISMVSYLCAWVYMAIWIGWYWGTDNATERTKQMKNPFRRKHIHKWDQIITGFRHDGCVIGMCETCGMPIVIHTIKCTENVLRYMQMTLEYGAIHKAHEDAIKGGQGKL